jgi:1-acyl-sn-glycerol-3-phosphate acyltransferase
MIAWIFTGVYWVVVLTVYLITLRKLPESTVRFFIRFWGKTVLKIAGIHLNIQGNNLTTEVQSRVVICNHQSALDIVIGAAICPPNVLVIGKKEIIWVPFLNLAWWAFRFIRIDRKNKVKAIGTLQGVSQKIKEGRRSLMIAPEGTRTPDGSILPFKKGAFYIAIQGQIPVFPFLIDGAFDLMPKKAFLAKSGKINLRFLDPIETNGMSLADVDSLKTRIRNQMVDELQRTNRSKE